jgi:hypothetical protein
VGDEAVDAMALSRVDVTALFGPLHRLIIQVDDFKLKLQLKLTGASAVQTFS